MKFNIIGDIHSRANWKDVIREDMPNIFVGDYFSPYERKSFAEQMSIFKDIVNFKMTHEDTILLIGNHDEDHWHINERYSRYDGVNMPYIKEAFEENKELFQLAYSIENKALVTHAGVSAMWYERYVNDLYTNVLTSKIVNLSESTTSDDINEAIKEYNDRTMGMMDKIRRYAMSRDEYIYKLNGRIYVKEGNEYVKREYTPDEVAEKINDMWRNGYRKYAPFMFDDNNDGWDTYGEDIHQSPLWIRPETLFKSNIFYGTDIWQIVGHTQMAKYPAFNTIRMNNIAFVDCLGQTTASLIFDTETKKMEINNIKNE